MTYIHGVVRYISKEQAQAQNKLNAAHREKLEAAMRQADRGASIRGKSSKTHMVSTGDGIKRGVRTPLYDQEESEQR